MSKKSGNACRGNCYEITNPAYCCILPWESLKNIWEINIKPHNCILLAFLQAAKRHGHGHAGRGVVGPQK